MYTKIRSKVIVLMSTYNGEQFLREQIDSVLQQSGIDVTIFVRDDGSNDHTTNILKEYQAKSLLEWYSGINLGPAKSFLDCLSKSPEADFYAFCDQDDVWEPNKLSSAIERIMGYDIPAMYCSDTLLVDKNLCPIKKGDIYVEGSFVESLISNPVTGCTMVINKSLRDIVKSYNPKVIDMHDWWIYRICTAINGYFYFDHIPHLKYRQHGKNVVGGITSKYSKIKRRLSKLLSSSEGMRLVMSKELLKGYGNIIPEKNKKILYEIVTYKNSLRNTLYLAFDSKIKLKSNKISSNFRKAVLLRKF